MILYSLALAVVPKYMAIDTGKETLLLFGLEGLIALNLLFTLLRTLRYYYSLFKLPCGESERPPANRYRKLIKGTA
jgi:hypothetical protein